MKKVIQLHPALICMEKKLQEGHFLPRKQRSEHMASVVSMAQFHLGV